MSVSEGFRVSQGCARDLAGTDARSPIARAGLYRGSSGFPPSHFCTTDPLVVGLPSVTAVKVIICYGEDILGSIPVTTTTQAPVLSPIRMLLYQFSDYSLHQVASKNGKEKESFGINSTHIAPRRACGCTCAKHLCPRGWCSTILFQRAMENLECDFWLRWKQSGAKKEISGRPSWKGRKYLWKQSLEYPWDRTPFSKRSHNLKWNF